MWTSHQVACFVQSWWRAATPSAFPPVHMGSHPLQAKQPARTSRLVHVGRSGRGAVLIALPRQWRTARDRVQIRAAGKQRAASLEAHAREAPAHQVQDVTMLPLRPQAEEQDAGAS
jgi:hypothetical protein